MSTRTLAFRWIAWCTAVLFLYLPGLSGVASGADVCLDYTDNPPFLTEGIDPNMLLLIDNSASMYDLAYVMDGSQGYCFDDSFQGWVRHEDQWGEWYDINQYVGYFDPWDHYKYNFTTNQFEYTWDIWTIADTAAGDKYRANTAPAEWDSDHPWYWDVFVAIDSGTVTAFYARGNFLNWAATSKFDIEKYILTGGKYDETNQLMVMESRGCLGRRSIKKIKVNKIGDTVTDYHLTLGVRGPDADEQTDDAALTGSVNTTRIDIFDITETGFDNAACQAAIEALQTGNLGTLKQDTKDCMGYTNASGSAADTYSAFNHALQECWYYNKQGEWQNGNGTVTSMMNDCEKVYQYYDPENITTDEKAYVCYGVYNNTSPAGYVGRCWESATSTEPETCEEIEVCINYNPQGKCTKTEIQTVCSGGGSLAVEGWTDDDGDGGVACVDQAIKDYCMGLEIPEVVDPSDAADETGEIWNIPAVLIDSGAVSQLGEPIAVMRGNISPSWLWPGLIQRYAKDIRMGAMIFNDNGSASECLNPEELTGAEKNILYDCWQAGNKDGGKIISYIDKSDTHTAELVSAINDIEATSWTPLAEAVYNAIGYYTQASSLRIDANDFIMDTDHPDPVIAWCQNNNILVITEGASTADLNTDVETFIGQSGQSDEDSNDSSDCGDLEGSSFLDDLAWYAWQGEDIYPVEQFVPTYGEKKQNIKTHIVVDGSARGSDSNECDALGLMTATAENSETPLYMADNPDELRNKLQEAFESIRSGVATGSAASVISASRGGEGAVYQAIFWPRVENDWWFGTTEVNWLGEVHALFVDAYGEMYEDTNRDRTRDGGDQRVTFFFDEPNRTTRVCVGGELLSDGSCTGQVKNIHEISYLWSAGEWLAKYWTGYDESNRSLADYISANRERYIFTWNDLDNDGIVDSGEVGPFTVRNDWESVSTASSRGPVPSDFGVATTEEVNHIIRWVRGYPWDSPSRNRQLQWDVNHDGTLDSVHWKLGDVIHSTPLAVGQPVENLHFIYRDLTYATFVNKYLNRRNVIYFGANDGMLHAVNGGFYNDSNNKFYLGHTADGFTDTGDFPELGAELWAYVPYNALPHLKCLADPDYSHKYYVDMKPRVFDVKIFADDLVHPGGWGTILVGGMRFGGGKVGMAAADNDGDGNPDYPDADGDGNPDYTDNREFISSYFILDVTDPEQPPTLLAEMTRTDTGSEANMGYSTVIPTVVSMTSDSGTDGWYLIFGSGPTDLGGTSSQNAKLAVFPLNGLGGSSKPAFRIPDQAPGASQPGVFTLADANSFISDPITVDFELDRYYKSDAVYFGTVSGTWGNWGGKVYRLVTRSVDADGNQLVTTPNQWANLATPNPKALIDTARPVTAPPAIGTDGYNKWVFFGTGRFFDEDDKSDASSNAQEAFYGIKEPLDCDGNLTWETVEKTGTPNTTAGSQGLLQVDQIEVQLATSADEAYLSCKSGSCLPAGDDGNPISTLDELTEYILGTGCDDLGYSTGTDGWFKEFPDARERNLGQATLLGGLVTFTTYQPYEDACKAEGLGFLYGSYFKTGTPWYKAVFGDVDGTYTDGQDAEGQPIEKVVDRLSLGRGLALTPNENVGKEEGAVAFVQTSTGTIVEIKKEELPIPLYKSGKVSWMEVSD